MHHRQADINADFLWQPQPAAAQLVGGLVEQLLGGLAAGRTLSVRLLNETGTRLVDWIDHLAVPGSPDLSARLRKAGFVPQTDATDEDYGGTAWHHPEGMFPLLVTSTAARSRLVFRVESVAEYARVHGLDSGLIDGDEYAALRKIIVAEQAGVEMWAVERHGWRGWQAPSITAEVADAVTRHDILFRQRCREAENEADGFDTAHRLIRAAVGEIGVDRACDLFFSAERSYWQDRNHAAQVQHARQDALAMGWANHDHHTYRSSRTHFTRLIAIFEALGCQCRERFYAGAEAGWGAQVLEQPECRIVIFADVDLSADELSNDFSHEHLPASDRLGTVGLWCRLHGEAFLQAGMHHLECQFDFDAARQQLAEVGIETMAPFTDFDHLKQAFTTGETWPVAPRRIDALLGSELITRSQADQFRGAGAIGSHLEILQRDDGYKGFNQTGVSEIILKTDPRR